MRHCFMAWLATAALAFATVAAAQDPKTTTDVAKYPSGSIKSKETTTTAADGIQKLSKIRTDYDERGRPINESETRYRPKGGTDQNHTKTWVYDEKGRLTYFESVDESVADPANFKPGVVSKYRVRFTYADDKDTVGTRTNEQVYSSVVDTWRDFDGEGGDTRPSMEAAQPLERGTEKNSAPHDGQGSPELRKTKLGGGINWIHAPNEAASNLIGFDLMAAYRVKPRLWIVGNVTSVSGSDMQAAGDVTFEQSLDRLVFAGGLELTLPVRGMLTPYVRGMIGQVHDSNHFGPGSSTATALAIVAGAGLDVALSRHLSATAGVDVISARFENGQENLRVSGGLSYAFGEHEVPRLPGGTISLENPFAHQVADADTALKAAKAAHDRAEAEMNNANSAWMKQNLTERGQRAVTIEKEAEKKAKAAFMRAADDLDKAKENDRLTGTQESFDKIDKARDALAEREAELSKAEADKRQQIRQGMTKEARAKYKAIDDAYEKAQDNYSDAKKAYDKWNKDQRMEVQ